MAALTYRYVALTDVGLRRPNNQDAGYASPRLLVIADGMGGAAAGDLASAITMEALREIDRDLDPETDGTALDALTDAVSMANHRVGEAIRSQPRFEGMGTTLDATLWDGEKLAVAHIGDSRMYRFRGGRLAQISTDHTFVQSLIDEGRLTRAEARVHPQRSLLLRAILGRDDFDPEFTWLQPAVGDRYLLCSDGLSDMVDDDIIDQALRLESVDAAAAELVSQALAAGGHDNVSVVIAEFVELNAPLDAELSCADGRPQVTGSAVENPQPSLDLLNGSDSGQAPMSDDVDLDEVDHPGGDEAVPLLDPEELRYAPLPEPKFRKLRVFFAIAVVILGAAAATAFAYDWTQRQFFIAANDGVVVIYRGVDIDVPGLDLHSVSQTTSISVDQLSTFSRQRVESGITATDMAEAKRIVKGLETEAANRADLPDLTGPSASPSPNATSNPTRSTSPSPTEPTP